MKTLKISILVASVVAASALAGTAIADQTDQNNFVNVGINGQYTMFGNHTPSLADNGAVSGEYTEAQKNKKSN